MTFAARTLGYLSSGANNGTLLAQSYTSDSVLFSIGYGTGIAGSTRTPSTFADGKVLRAVYYTYDAFSGDSVAYLEVSGFTSDPGRTGYFTNFTVGSTTLSAASSSPTLYGYSAGVASWAWPISAWDATPGSTSSWSKT